MIPMRISKTDLIYYSLAVFSFIISFYTIVIHIKFRLIPILFLMSGFLLSFTSEKNRIKVFLFLLPLINSSPGVYPNGYPFNLMGTVLFLLSGMILGSVVKREIPEFKRFEWSGVYLVFLSIVWLSAIFVFLRWSNLNLSFSAFFADTPVGPGLPISPRNSFATIFPVMTLSLFSVSPFVLYYLKKSKMGQEQLFNILIVGFSFSVLIAFIQKYVDGGLLSFEWWGEKLNQYNGGFSDFNGFGFFSGVIFLYSSLKLMRYYELQKKDYSIIQLLFYFFSILISLYGIILSGSRTAFIFVISAVIFLFFSKIRLGFKIAVPTLLLIFLMMSGGGITKRFNKMIAKIDKTPEKSSSLKILDNLSNGRLKMIGYSIPILKTYPISGIGTGNFLFYLKYLKYGEKFLEDLPLNQYLLFFDELGFVGLILFLTFLFIVLKGIEKDIYFKILVIILFVMIVGNSLWLPEISILFWIVIASLRKSNLKKIISVNILNKWWPVIVLVFIVFNIVSFKSLLPSRLMSDKGLSYDYGFFDEPGNSEFRWTGREAGILLKMSETGNSGPVKFFCGAPLGQLPQRSQTVTIYKGDKLIGVREFRSNGYHIFSFEGEPGEEYLLRIRVSPVFNLKEMGLGVESRTLGVQYFPGSD